MHRETNIDAVYSQYMLFIVYKGEYKFAQIKRKTKEWIFIVYNGEYKFTQIKRKRGIDKYHGVSKRI